MGRQSTSWSGGNSFVLATFLPSARRACARMCLCVVRSLQHSHTDTQFAICTPRSRPSLWNLSDGGGASREQRPGFAPIKLCVVSRRRRFSGAAAAQKKNTRLLCDCVPRPPFSLKGNSHFPIITFLVVVISLFPICCFTSSLVSSSPEALQKRRKAKFLE